MDNWLEDESDAEYDNLLIDINEDDSEYSDQEPEELSENEDEDNFEHSYDNSKEYYLSRNNLIEWSKKPPPPSKTKNKNIVTHLPGVKSPAKNLKTPLECWEYYFPEFIMHDIEKFTNIKLLKMSTTYARPRDCLPTNVDEIKALFGLLYLAGVNKMSHVNVKDLWATDGMAPEVFRCVMTYKRFGLLLTALRFDDVDTRKDRAKNDKLSPIRDLWDHFNLRCQNAYTPGEYCTIDEMISPFRGRCSFKQYIPSKPNKYGLKSFVLSDARTFYVVKLEMYVGKQPAGPYQLDNKPSSIVKRIAQPILHTGRNITMDNWFTSIPLATELVKNYKTTIVGTLRKNKPEIPSEFINPKNRSVNTSLFGFYEDLCLVSYIPKKNKCVIVLSSMHQNTKVNEMEKNKPEIITFYNFTKCGVDVTDKLKATYSVSRCSFRWPLTAFFTLLDVGGINGAILHYCNTSGGEANKLKRRTFLKNLGYALIESQLKKRLCVPNLAYDLNIRIKKILSNMSSDTVSSTSNDNSTPGRCYICPLRKNRKSKSSCIKCCRFLCLPHTIKMCGQCYGTEENDDMN